MYSRSKAQTYDSGNDILRQEDISQTKIKPAGPTYGLYRDGEYESGRIPLNPLHTPPDVIAHNLSELTEVIITSSTKTGKDDDQPLSIFSELSSYADFQALSSFSPNAEEQPQEGQAKASTSVYSAVCATRHTMLKNGMRSLYMSKGEYITSTGAHFDPKASYVTEVFRTVILMDPKKIRRAQAHMMLIIRQYFVPGLFRTLNRTYPASHWLQLLWVYLFNKVHQVRSSLVQYKEQWSVRPLTNVHQLEETLRQAAALNICTNLLERNPPLDVNSELVGQLIQALRLNSSTAPPPIQAEFNSITESLKTLHEAKMELTPTSLLISLGSLYDTPSVHSVETHVPSPHLVYPNAPNSDANSGRLSETTTSQAAFAAFADGPVQETIDHAAFAAYSDRSGSKPKPNVTRTPSASKATPDPGPDELTLHQLQKLSEVIQSQLSRQARKAETKTRTSDNGKHQAYAADSREYALGAVPLRPATRRHSSSGDSDFEMFH